MMLMVWVLTRQAPLAGSLPHNPAVLAGGMVAQVVELTQLQELGERLTRGNSVLLCDFEHVAALRAAWPGLGLVVVASTAEMRTDCLRRGADMTVAPDIADAELVAVLQALARRLRCARSAAVPLEPVPWRMQGRRLWAPDGRDLLLSTNEYIFMALLAERAPQPVARELLCARLGYEAPHPDARDMRLEALVSRLRRKLAVASLSPLRAARWQGYFFAEPILRLAEAD